MIRVFGKIIKKIKSISFLCAILYCTIFQCNANENNEKRSLTSIDSDVVYLVNDEPQKGVGRYIDKIITHKPVNAITRIYLQKIEGTYTLYVNLDGSVKFTPRVHTTSKKIVMSLSFDKNITCPRCNNFKHRLIKQLQFSKISDKSLLIDIEFSEEERIVSKKFTKHGLKVKFNLVKKKRVIIDAGHGGKDPGAVGINNDYEKNMTLVFAKGLRELLEQSGKYNVIMLRDNDRTYSVDERVSDISKTKADILISLHTDSNPNSDLRGMSIYTLPEILNGRESTIEYINILHRSRDLAQRVISYVPQNCKIKKDQCRGVELKILKIGIPAILIELGCLSNKIDHALLHTKEFRNRMIRAIFYALEDYFEQRQ